MYPFAVFFWALIGVVVACLLVDFWYLRREKQRLRRDRRRLRQSQHLDSIEAEWQRYVRKYEERKAAGD